MSHARSLVLHPKRSEDRSAASKPEHSEFGQSRHLGSRASVEEIDAQSDRLLPSSLYSLTRVGTILGILLQTKEPGAARQGCRIGYSRIKKLKRAASAWG